MANVLIKTIKKTIGPSATKIIAPFYHGLRGLIQAEVSGKPAQKLYIIGITGTKGKTSTTAVTGRLFNSAGIKTGYISTAVINETGNSEDEYQNPYKMTNIDPAIMQRVLAKMVANGCTHVVIELSSEGLKQNRHKGLGGFDCTVFLNLYPEHIESHGSLQNYMLSKAKLFANLKPNGIFIGNGYQKFIDDRIVDDQLERTKFMSQAIKHDTVTRFIVTPGLDYRILNDKKKLTKSLNMDGHTIDTGYYADFEIRNLAFSLTILKAVNATLYHDMVSHKKEYFKNSQTVPGRMDWVVVDGEILR